MVADGSRQIDLTLRPMNPDIALTADEIVLKSPIKFKQGPAKLTPEWQAELDGVAEVMEDRPDIRILRVEAHWDPSAGAKAKEVTDAHARLGEGVPGEEGHRRHAHRGGRHGFGSAVTSQDVTPVYKAKNRRVELHVIR